MYINIIKIKISKKGKYEQEAGEFLKKNISGVNIKSLLVLNTLYSGKAVKPGWY